MQSAFDATEFGKIDYQSSIQQDSQLGRLFSVEVDMYTSDSTIGASFQFNTFIIWGAMKVGERYNGDRILTWFRNLPFTVGMYTAGAGTVSVTADGQVLPSIILSDRKVYNLTLQGIDANRDVVLNLPGTSAGASVFDNTFDFTFHALTNVAANVRLLVDECTDGIYLRWINRHGFYCYWLFKRGDESKQIALSLIHILTVPALYWTVILTNSSFKPPTNSFVPRKTLTPLRNMETKGTWASVA